MVLSTAISLVRSRALIIMALAVTSRIANTTAMPMVPISRLTLPHMVAKLALNACSVPVLVGALRVPELVVQHLGDRGGVVGVGDLEDVPARHARPPGTLLEVLMMEEHHVVVDDRIGRRVGAADGEGPVAREDRALERDVLAERQPKRSSSRRPTIAEERSRRKACFWSSGSDDLGIHVEVRLGVHGELGEEALVVAVLAAEPVGPGDLVIPFVGAEPVGVARAAAGGRSRWRWS